MQAELTINEHIQIQPVKEADAAALFALIDQNRADLLTWLPWVSDIESIADELSFLKYVQQQMAEQKLWMATIWVDQQLAGTIDVHQIDMTTRTGEIGYWLGTAFRGQGVTVQAVGAVEQFSANELDLDVLQLIVARDNVASHHVAQKADYTAIDEVAGVTLVNQHPQVATRYQKRLGGC